MRNFLHYYAAAIAWVCCSLISPAQAEDIPPSPIVKATLAVYGDQPQIAGSGFTATVRFDIPEHWHIYWLNPGDSGIPTTVAWQPPEGYTLGAEPEYWLPAPSRIDMASIINYGFSDTLFISRGVIPQNENATGTLRVKASWLVCKDICIPESAELSAEIPQMLQKISSAPGYESTSCRFPGTAWYEANATDVKLYLDMSSTVPNDTSVFAQIDAQKTHFIPLEEGVMQNLLPTKRSVENNILTLTMPRGSGELPAEWHGVLVDTKTTGDIDDCAGIYLTAEKRGDAAEDAQISIEPAAPATTNTPLITTLALAFLGGLILNIMPCVLPILALKALAITKKAHASRAAAAKQGLAYTAGVVGSFMAIAAIMLALKATGAAIGWGFQLQNAPFVALLAGVMLLVSANLLGLFTLPALFGEKATGVDENSVRGSLLTGALAVLVATPCTAPFMATAIGATLSMPTLAALAVFAALGLGMASPFLLISLWPAARRLLPKPGAWMHRFKQLLAIPMLATAAWLIWVLVQLHSPNAPMKDAQHVPYAADTLAELRAAGTPVFVDATAAWCLTCKVNERLALNTPEMQEFLRSKNVVMMVADWTNSDPAITQYLASFGRNGVPIYVYYPPHGEPKLLPQILTPSIVREAITSNP